MVDNVYLSNRKGRGEVPSTKVIIVPSIDILTWEVKYIFTSSIEVSFYFLWSLRAFLKMFQPRLQGRERRATPKLPLAKEDIMPEWKNIWCFQWALCRETKLISFSIAVEILCVYFLYRLLWLCGCALGSTEKNE